MAIEYGDGSNSNTGRIIQVVQTTFQGTHSSSSSSDVAITGMNTSITPKETASRIQIAVHIGTCGASGSNNYLYFSLYRGSVNLPRGNTDGNRKVCTMSIRPGVNHEAYPMSMIYIDTPNTTSSVTYYLKYQMEGGTGYINANGLDYNQTNYPRTISTMILTEIAA
jgi:hypothetical protein|tara:strand:+ start:24 stop:521 length:498 start_codon:yes stop_codon:yes gene_type:complete